MYHNKTLWVIGAGSDIALAFLKSYAPRFEKVVLASNHTNRIQVLSKKHHINNAQILKLDLCSSKSIYTFVHSAPAPDYVVCFSGHLIYNADEENVSPQNISKTFAINATGVITLLENAIPRMKSGGSIIVLTSCAGVRGKASNRVYSASKAAMSTYLQGLSQKCNNICIIDLKLGRVRTKMLKKSPRKTNFFSMSSKKCADLIFELLGADESIVYYQPSWHAPILLFNAIPKRLYDKFRF